MDQLVTKRDVNEIVDKAISDLSEVIADLAQATHDRFQEVYDRFDRLEARFERNHNEVLDRMDSFLKRTSDKDIEDAARNAQLDRHESWIKKLADKTDIELTQ